MPAETHAPVDTSVNVPEVVRRAAAEADARHKAAYPDASPDPAPAPDPAADPQPQPEPASPPHPDPAPDAHVAAPAAGEPDWEARYHSMEGRYKQSMRTLGGMQEQLSDLGSELVRTQALLRGAPAQAQPAPGEPVQVLTDEDRQNYGPDLINVAKRAALEAVSPELNSLKSENSQLRQRVTQQAQAGVYQSLDLEIPNWRQINDSERFKQWVRLPDLYSGVPKGRLLNDAFRAANAPRVVAFFRGFLAEEVATGQQPAPQPLAAASAPARTAAVSLESLAAPGKAKPATGNDGVPADKPIITRAQISAFYSQEGRARYVGREADRKADEAMIFAAQKEGRVR